MLSSLSLISLLFLSGIQPDAKKEPPKNPKETIEAKNPAASFGAFRLRSIGPAVTSGRIIGLAVDPKDRSHYYVAVACGGVFKTTNSGTSWTPVFDNEASYSIGCITLDPKNSNTIWVGSGENNSQRSVGYGDGVYKSTDAGKTWQNMGLKTSEHIGKILIDPRDSNTIYVAAQGPLWKDGGDRGLYKSTNGGETWTKILNVSERTGITDIVSDPRNPDILIAASYQRRRHVWTLINGGPESAIYRSTDAGKTWKKIKAGLPSVDMGRIGLAMAPTNPDIIYATVEATDRKGGIFRSNDGGISWEKRNDFDQQAQYYAHLVVDPINPDRIYIMSVLIQVSNDGGKTLQGLGEPFKHVDNHEIWIDPKNPDYYLVGCDGGVYESFDRAANWHFKSNLPVTQFYDITADEDAPFYNVYGGTQDNYTLGGPARSKNSSGIPNSDWFVVQGGDGFHCKVDPKDPDIVYAEAQYAGIVRFDRRTGQRVGIQPQPGKGEPPLRWNWDSPLLISPHLNTRLYFAANRLFQSDDRGNSWTPISPDLTRQLNRDLLPVFGKVWGPDAVAKNVSTSFYGNCVALTESPLQEGLIYVGTDDGLIQVTADRGKNWQKIDKFPGIPNMSYVARLFASQHSAKTVYAAFDNHKMGDFAPYLLKSTDMGQNWTSIVNDLPGRGSVLAFVEDPVDPDLLFVGTEFGLFFSNTGGQKWHRLQSGLPTIAVRDLVIQKKMNDLVVGTFGRGIYILDDFSALRFAKPKALENEFQLFPIQPAVQYFPMNPIGGRGKGFLGESFYLAENAPYGATITYYLKEGILTEQQKRRKLEKKADPKNPTYPTPDQLRAEVEEETPTMLITIRGADGKIVKTLSAPATAGFHRVIWDLTENPVLLSRPVAGPPGRSGRGGRGGDRGPLVLTGEYEVSMQKRVQGADSVFPIKEKLKVVSDASFQSPKPAVNIPESLKLTEANRKLGYDFRKKLGLLQKKLHGTVQIATEITDRLDQMKFALDQAPEVTLDMKFRVRKMITLHREILRNLNGDSILAGMNMNVPLSISDRVGYCLGSIGLSDTAPTKTVLDSYQIASDELTEELKKLKQLLDVDIKTHEKELDKIGAPWTTNRWPVVEVK